MPPTDSLLPYESQADAEQEITPAQDSAERAQARLLEIDASMREAYVARESQRHNLREKAYIHAVAVCLGLASYVALMVFVIAVSEKGRFASEAQIAIFATPIVALAAITIFMLRGVFSGFSEKSFSEDVQVASQLSNQSQT